MNEISPEMERKLYDLLDEKLAEFYYKEIPEIEFAEKWDRYLREVGVGWTPHRVESGKHVISDPLYTRGGYLHIEHDLVSKILAIGLP
jgi:hypothetical protein